MYKYKNQENKLFDKNEVMKKLISVFGLKKALDILALAQLLNQL